MRPGRPAGYALLVLAVALLGVAVVSGLSGATGITVRSDEAAAAEEATTAFVLAFGTFDHAASEGYASGLAALATGTLRASLEQTGVADDAQRLQRSLRTRVETASISALDDGEATVTVTAVQERRWRDAVLDAPRSEAVRQRLACRLVEVGGRWLVAELRLLSEEPAREPVR